MSAVARMISPSDSPRVVACGMVTALGSDAVSTCAAARAGVSRATSFPWMTASPDDGEDIPLLVHAVRDLTRGFEGPARLLRLAELGLRSLARETGAPSLAGVPLYVSLPNPLRELEGVALVSEASRGEAPRAEVDEEEKEDSGRIVPPRETLERAWGLAVGGSPELRFVSQAGHAGFAQCLGRVVDDFSAKGSARAIVGGVDTLLTTETLEWFESTRRLKTAAAPVGLIPGEASVFFLVERGPGAQTGIVRPACRISALAYADESKTLLDGGPASGEAIADAVCQLQTMLGARIPLLSWIVSDHTGEHYRAVERGLLYSRLVARKLITDTTKEWLPALSVGDTGAASGAIALAMAWRAIERGYAPAQSALLLSSSEGSLRAVTVVAA